MIKKTIFSNIDCNILFEAFNTTILHYVLNSMAVILKRHLTDFI